MATFRRQRGLNDAAKHASHACVEGCSWTQLEAGAWACDRSGFVHVCDAMCKERVLDPSTETLVCHISGRCFERLMSEHEEAEGDQERGEQERGQPWREEQRAQDEDWAAEEGMGRLGRAFLAGYNAADEGELRQLGIRFQ